MATGHADRSEEVRVLARAIDQAAVVLDQVRPESLEQATPCPDWRVSALLDHLVAAPRNFLTMMRGEGVDWSTPPAHVAESWGPAFRAVGDDLVHAWHQA